jgi:hypothetical protein
MEAYELLLHASNRLPADEIIAYDLAYICCALKRTDEARSWLAKAVNLGGDEIKLRALDDPDLQSLWENLEE